MNTTSAIRKRKERAIGALNPAGELVRTLDDIKNKWPRQEPTEREEAADASYAAARDALIAAQTELAELCKKRQRDNFITASDDDRIRHLSWLIDYEGLRQIKDSDGRVVKDNDGLTRVMTLARVEQTHAREEGGRYRVGEAKRAWVTLRDGVLARAFAVLSSEADGDHGPLGDILRHEIAAAASSLEIPRVDVPADYPETKAEHVAAGLGAVVEAFYRWHLEYCAPAYGLQAFGHGAGTPAFAHLGRACAALGGLWQPPPSAAPSAAAWMSWAIPASDGRAAAGGYIAAPEEPPQPIAARGYPVW